MITNPYFQFHGRLRGWKIMTHFLKVGRVYGGQGIQGTEVTLDGKYSSSCGCLRQCTWIYPWTQTSTILLQKLEKCFGIIGMECA